MDLVFCCKVELFLLAVHFEKHDEKKKLQTYIYFFISATIFCFFRRYLILNRKVFKNWNIALLKNGSCRIVVKNMLMNVKHLLNILLFQIHNNNCKSFSMPLEFLLCPFLSYVYNLFSGSNDNANRIYDIETSKQFITFEGHINDFNCVEHVSNEIRISGCVNTILSGSCDKSVRLWNITSCQQIQMFNEYIDWTMFVDNEFDDKLNVICSELYFQVKGNTRVWKLIYEFFYNLLVFILKCGYLFYDFYTRMKKEFC
ncbi:hypothetical protein RFI_18759 [Reticulomyxa filosa]|uniref:Uncharacterized protein n=1 Tax=Reticulomyxa filosa TaxID=46433 RepID=X6MWX9_RETFI|nr:hypothetical protein RFI_18759 [Reticulomyxa filosa]|eukprot:ETO18508.1 hypothetical protein RFI_18759 [Reticulomyxa filosa]